MAKYKFKYKIRVEDGGVYESYKYANDAYEVAESLKNYQIISIEREMTFVDLILTKDRLTKNQLITIFSTIGSLDAVGIDLMQSLKLLKDEIASNENMKIVCTEIYRNVSFGMKLSDACQRSSSSFTHETIGLIKIAEKTGQFYRIFVSLVEYIKWNEDIKRKSKKAINGPLMTLLLMFSILMLLSIFAIPKILDFLKYFNMEPPLSTVLLVKFAYFMKNYSWIPIVFVTGFKIISTIFYKKFTAVQIKIDKLKLFLPIVGDIILKINVTKFISLFTLMYNAGSDILEILESISKTIDNKYIGSRVENIKKSVENGESIFKAIDNETVFPIMFRKMIAVCELSGNPVNNMMSIKNIYDQELNDAIEKMIGAIKPIMTILLGLMLSWIGSAMLGPIYSNIGNLGETTKSSSVD